MWPHLRFRNSEVFQCFSVCSSAGNKASRPIFDKFFKRQLMHQVRYQGQTEIQLTIQFLVEQSGRVLSGVLSIVLERSSDRHSDRVLSEQPDHHISDGSPLREVLHLHLRLENTKFPSFSFMFSDFLSSKNRIQGCLASAKSTYTTTLNTSICAAANQQLNVSSHVRRLCTGSNRFTIAKRSSSRAEI